MTDTSAVAGHPIFDLVTANSAIVLTRRPVVPLSSWLTSAIRATADAGLALDLVTPATTRLTMPALSVLTEPYLRWVVGHSHGFYDGLTGVALRFDDGGFAPELDADGQHRLADPYQAIPEGADGTQLTLSFRVRHPATETTVLGGSTEIVYESLTGNPPSGWGTSEPAPLTWRTQEITRLCQERAPETTWFCHTGRGERPAIGTTSATRVSAGIDEQVTVHVGSGSGESPPLEALSEAVSDLAIEFDLVELLAHVRPGRADLTAVPHFTGLPIPVGMAIGSDAVRELGRGIALTVPGIPTQPIGDRRDPAAWYPLGDGRSSGAWARLAELLRHLRTGRLPRIG